MRVFIREGRIIHQSTNSCFPRSRLFFYGGRRTQWKSLGPESSLGKKDFVSPGLCPIFLLKILSIKRGHRTSSSSVLATFSLPFGKIFTGENITITTFTDDSMYYRTSISQVCPLTNLTTSAAQGFNDTCFLTNPSKVALWGGKIRAKCGCFDYATHMCTVLLSMRRGLHKHGEQSRQADQIGLIT